VLVAKTKKVNGHYVRSLRATPFDSLA